MNYQSTYQIKPFGRHAIIIAWQSKIDKDILTAIVSAEHAINQMQCVGIIELVPTYNELTVFFEPAIIQMKSVISLCDQALQKATIQTIDSKVWNIEVCYNLQYGIDLNKVSEKTGLSINDVIEIHSSQSYDVHFFGFLPGFMYLGGLDARLAIPRLANPRKLVENGSVAIANGQTGIYPVDSPGGWNIIGKTKFKVFDHKNDPPCQIKAGDTVRFKPIDQDSFLKKTRYD